MKKNILPILLIAGAAIAFLAMRRRPRVTVTAESPIKQTEAEFEAELVKKPSALDIGTQIVSTIFKPKTEKEKAAKAAQRVAVKRAVKTKAATKKQARAVTKALERPAFIRGFGDQVLV